MFFHGSGEAGTTPSKIYNSTTAGGPAYLIEHGQWPVGFNNYRTNTLDTPIVMCPQTNNNWSSSGDDIEKYINTFLLSYPIDVNRIYLTGLSSGGGGVIEFCAHLNGDENSQLSIRTHKAAAIVPMSAATNRPQRPAWANQIVADGTSAWGHGDPNNDVYGEYTQDIMVDMGTTLARFTANTYGHGGWNNIYTPTFRQTFTTQTISGPVTHAFNIYEWMMTQERSSNTPTANAGSAQTVLLPTTTATLSGSSSTAGTGRSLVSYHWDQLSGTTATITSPNSVNSGISGLTTVGDRIFQLTVTDDIGQTSTASVIVSVQSTTPTANAGSNHIVTLPTTQVSLTGTPTMGAGRSLDHVSWTLLSGPNSPTITNPSNSNTTVTGLIVGTYVFRYTVTDDASQTAFADNMTFVVSASYASPTVTVSGNQTITLPTSSVNLTSTANATGASVTSTTWSKVTVPGFTPVNVGILGSSYSIDYGASVNDSGAYGGYKIDGFTHGRFYDYYHGLGLVDSVINLGVTGTNIYQAMPTGYVPPLSIQAKLSPNDTPHVASNITAMLRHNIKVLLLVYPTNGYDVFTISEMVTPFQAIYDTCVSHGIQCYIVTTAPRTDGTFSDPADRAFLKTVSDTLVNRFGSHAIAIYDALVQTGTTSPIAAYAVDDSIHMNDAGQRVMFTLIQSRNVFSSLLTSASSITAATSANTSVTGLTAGTHRFQASVMDSHGQAAVGTTTVTVNGTGTVTANAGGPYSITLPTNSIDLDGSGSSGATSYLWTQVSGPSTATITGSTAVIATASNLIAGIYTFRLSLNGGASVTQAVVTVNIKPPVGPCQGAKYFLAADPMDSSIYISEQAGAVYQPGDTLVVPAGVSTLDLGGLHGRSGCPIVVINQAGGLSYITQHVALYNCTYVKFTGSGANVAYGFLIEQDPVLRQQSDHGFEIQAKSKNIEVERVSMHNVDMGFVAEGVEDCDNSLNYPNWVMDSLSLHDNKIVGTWNEGMYIGNTSPDNASYDLRPLTCNGVTSYPAPAKNGYIHIFNNIVDSTGRGGIQVSNAASGVSEINNNLVSHNGLNGDDAQGSAITLGLYTRAYVHDNAIRNTYTWGIASIGAGATNIPLRIENNHIDSSGYLRAYNLATTNRTVYDPRTEPTTAAQLAWPQAIEIDSRPRLYTTDTPHPGTAVAGQDSTVFTVKNNTIGLTKSGVGLNVDDDYAGLQANGHVVCGNVNSIGAPATIVIKPAISVSNDCQIVVPPCNCLQFRKPIILH